MTASTPTAIPATQRMIVIQRTMRVLSGAGAEGLGIGDWWRKKRRHSAFVVRH
jgi:hypothetical protein